jgi:hypothetical protein
MLYNFFIVEHNVHVRQKKKQLEQVVKEDGREWQ